MSAIITRGFLVGLVFVIAAMAVPPAGAAAPEGAGALYFTSTIESENTAPATVAQCGSVATYAMTADAPEGIESSKAYMAGSGVAIACAASFSYLATTPFQLSGEAIAHLFIGCDLPTVFRTGEAADNAEVPPTSIRVSLMKNGAEISRVAVYLPAPTVCLPGDVIEVEVAGLPTNEAEFDEGDILRLDVPVFSSNAKQAAGNVHFLVGTNEHPTAFHAVGLPGGAAEAALELVASQADVTVEAGSQASVDLEIYNGGAENATFNVSVAGAPEGLDVTVAPSSGQVEANGTAVAVLTATAAESLSPGPYLLNVTVSGPTASNASLNLTVTVVAAAADEEPAEEEQTPGNETEDAEPAGDALVGNETGDGGSVPGPAAGLSIAAIVSGLLVAAVRRGRHDE